MKNSITLVFAIIFSIAAVNAQSIEKPLQDKFSSEIIPKAPSSEHVYVKGHYEFADGKYNWVNGSYVSALENHTWVDGQWVEDANTNLYSYKSGYWKSNAEIIEFNGVAYMPGHVTDNSSLEIIHNESFTEVITD